MGSVPLRIMNVQDKPCFLHKHTITAMYEPVETKTFETVNSVITESTSNEDSSSHIEDLISRSSENLNESQKEQLAALLREYKDQFRGPHMT